VSDATPDGDDRRDLWLFKSYWDEADVEAVTDVIRRGTWWAKGDEIAAFEAQMADVCDRDHAIAVNSGTTALYLALLAHDVTDGEVIVPSFTFPATANAVVAAGARPVFADIERDSLALSADAVRDRITADTRAIMPIHFAGDVAADIFELRDLADDHGLHLFEDACHSPGATYRGEPVGSFGDAAAFSFCFNKILTTGEGGMVVTDADETAERLRLLRSHGRDADREYVTWGHNVRMSSMTAALGVAQAEKLDWMIERRREMAARLNDALRGIDGLHLPEFPDERESVYQLYNLRFDEDGIQGPLADHLDARGVPTRVTYDPVHLTRYYREEWGWEPGDLPVTERVSERILTLPFHLDLSDDDLDHVARAVRAFFGD
jgi:perosamine synthetase